MKFESEEQALIFTGIVLAEDLWSECKFKGWDSGKMWDENIAPFDSDVFFKVKRLISINDGERLLSVELVEDEMIINSLKDTNTKTIELPEKYYCECGEEVSEQTMSCVGMCDSCYSKVPMKSEDEE